MSRPFSAMRSAISFPKPRLPPVTNAILFIVLLFYSDNAKIILKCVLFVSQNGMLVAESVLVYFLRSRFPNAKTIILGYIVIIICISYKLNIYFPLYYLLVIR